MAQKNSIAITNALKALEKRYGEVVVQRMGDTNTTARTFSSGRVQLDNALGGGYGVGKVHEIYAESGCGKTGLALEAIASIQSTGGKVAFIDCEHALNTGYCEQIGVAVEDLYIAQPTYGEQAIEIIRALIDTKEFDLIVVDSVAAMIPLAELEGEVGEIKMALQARMMSKGMKQIIGPASANDCTVLFINQLRKTIAMYGPTETTTGGKALKFYACQRLEVKNKGTIKEGDEVIGFKQQISVVKNKIGTPYKVIQQDILYGKGIDDLGGLIETCVFEGILEKKGSYIKYGETNLAQGLKKLRIVLEDNPDLVDELKEKLKEKSK